MIGDVAQSRWTLRFRDPALERAYRDDLALQLRTQITVFLAFVLAIWVSSGRLDREIAGSPANAEMLMWFRYAVGAPPLLVTVLLVWRLPEAAFLRWQRVILWVGTTQMTVVWVLLGALLPDPEVSPVSAAAQSWILGVFAYGLFYGIEYARAVPSLVVASALYLAVGLWRFPQLTQGDLNNTVGGLVAAIIGAYILEQSRRRAFIAQRRADRLLENVMPASIAERLKHGERRIAEHHDAATVLFADLVGFTTIAANLPPGELVDTLDDVFSTFDDLAERHGLEKIKTIGDAYMVVGGVPTARADHAQAVASMALAMRDAVAARGGAWQIRIGIHTGPVVAGVIGKRKFIYDLWGDTVNLASRMESHGVAGAIQVSAETAAALDGAFVLEPRGPIAIKGKGELPAYLLSGTVPP